MSHIQQQRDLFAKNRAIIQRMLKWSDLDYTTFQFESGLVYLNETLRLHDFEVEMLSYDELFWKWWINEWNLLDSVQTPLFERMQRPLLVSDYVRIHTLAMVDKSPSNVVLEESYAKFIGTFNDKHNSHANS